MISESWYSAKNPSKWVVTGKVALKGFFITNAAKDIVTVENAIKELPLHDQLVCELISEIDQVSLCTVNQLGQYYQRKRRMGIDNEGEIWIIEVNLNPNIEMFKILGDETVLNTIETFRKG